MQKFTFHRKVTRLFTDQQNQLVYNQDELLEFIAKTFSKENFESQIKIKRKSFTQKQRETLVFEFKKKYSPYERSQKVSDNISALNSENTFTVTTGHQLSIFTGPIFFVYKILHVIRLTEELKNTYPEYNFVPVYWMASEDHDFEEIRSFELFNKKITWDTNQSGPVGKFEINELEKLKTEVLAFFSNQEINEIEMLLNTYTGENLAEATFRLVHLLFESFGLLIVDGDNSGLKREFIPIFEKELNEQFSFHEIQKTNRKIEKEGLKIQVTGRELNLFYLGDQSRERIIKIENGFFIEGKGEINSQKLLFELHEYPERFSPNVILRPVYQESVLPNLCYVGGGGEISYWLQLKDVFDAVNIPYPLIQVRSSLLWIDSVTSKKMHKASILLEDLFKDASQVKKKYLAELESENTDFELLDEQFEQLKNEMIHRIICIDFSLDKFANAEMVKMKKQYDSIKEKLMKTVKQRHENAMKTIDQVFEKLMPESGLQERSINLFSICSDGAVNEKIDFLHSTIDPFDPDFIIIRE
jgi:bacillithiol biosynthesis cysteine-adding enzyme BshC